MMRTLYYVQYVLMRTVCVLVRLLPFRVAMVAARFVGRMLYYVLISRRNITLENLRLAFQDEKSERDIRKIGKQSFENLGMLALEFIWIPNMMKHLNHYMISEGQEYVRKALKLKKGVVLLVSHFGNWEWMAIQTGADGFPMHAVARPLRNPFVYKYIKKLRGLTGLQSVNKKGAARDTLKLLKENRVVAMLIDQHERQGSVRVPFFGREASTTTLPAILALKRGAAVVPAFFYRRQNAPSLMTYSRELTLIETGDYERDLFENTKQYVHVIEQEIRKHPGQWLWMHRRWKDAKPALDQYLTTQ